jgi:hypothetical protein
MSNKCATAPTTKNKQYTSIWSSRPRAMRHNVENPLGSEREIALSAGGAGYRLAHYNSALKENPSGGLLLLSADPPAATTPIAMRAGVNLVDTLLCWTDSHINVEACAGRTRSEVDISSIRIREAIRKGLSSTCCIQGSRSHPRCSSRNRLPTP